MATYSELRHAASAAVGRWLSAKLPTSALTEIANNLFERRLDILIAAFAPWNRRGMMDQMPCDLPVTGEVRFEHLAGLFSSTSLNHGVISMTIRQAAYLFGLVRQDNVTRAIEIGRYKGGSTLLLAAAMGPREERLWSIDLPQKATRLYGSAGQSFDEMLIARAREWGLEPVLNLITGDSRLVELDTGEVDLVLIDGDHSYDGARNDFQRFGRRVRRGGHLLFDDCFDDGCGLPSHGATVGRLVEEVVETGECQLVRRVDRVAHLRRV